MVACSDDGTLTLFNTTAQHWHGAPMYSRCRRQTGAHYYDLYAADGCTPLARDDIPLVSAWQGKPVENVEICIAAAGQPLRYVLCSGGQLYPERDRPGSGYRGNARHFRDSARKQYEESLPGHPSAMSCAHH